MRVVAWNLNGLRGDVPAVEAALQGLRPDIALLQEIPRASWGARRVRAIAARANMRVALGGFGTAGLAILIRPPLIAAQVGVQRLPRRRSGLWFAYPRGTAWAMVHGLGPKPVLVASAHLGLTSAERAEHTGRLVALARAATRRGVPMILGGDFNCEPASDTWRTLTEVLADATPNGPATFPADAPRARIDAIFTGGAVTASAVSGAVPKSAASDHLPVAVDIATARET